MLLIEPDPGACLIRCFSVKDHALASIVSFEAICMWLVARLSVTVHSFHESLFGSSLRLRTLVTD